MTMATEQIGEGLAERWQALLKEHPGLRIRDAARRLGVSELALLHCREAGNLKRLKPAFPSLMQALETAGEVMILTRNEPVVHEVTGTFADFKVAASGKMGLALGEMDVRVFFRQWRHGYWVREQVRSGIRESLQIFDASGRAVHKIYRTDGTEARAWRSLLERFVEDATPQVPELEPDPAPVKRVNAEEVDAEALQRDWLSLQDVHHFNAMLKRHGVDRLTALELVGPIHARRLEGGPDVDQSPLDELLERVRNDGCPVMVFVGNPGIVQIHTGTLNKVVRNGDWLNVLDPGFNLHARTTLITDWWLVRRPTEDGTVTSVEGYDETGNLVITVFGERKPGQPEDPRWKSVAEQLEYILCG